MSDSTPDFSQTPIFEIDLEMDRVVAGFVAVEPEPDGFNIRHMVVRKADGTRWGRVCTKDPKAKKKWVDEVTIDGMSDEEVVARTDAAVAEVKAQGLVVAVHMTDCTGRAFLNAMEASDDLEVINYFELEGERS